MLTNLFTAYKNLESIIPNMKYCLLDFVGIKLELEEALGSKVDLVEYSEIKSIIKNQILSEEVAIL